MWTREYTREEKLKSCVKGAAQVREQHRNQSCTARAKFDTEGAAISVRLA